MVGAAFERGLGHVAPVADGFSDGLMEEDGSICQAGIYLGKETPIPAPRYQCFAGSSNRKTKRRPSRIENSASSEVTCELSPSKIALVEILPLISSYSACS